MQSLLTVHGGKSDKLLKIQKKKKMKKCNNQKLIEQKNF